MCRNRCGVRHVVDRACTFARSVPDPRMQSIADTCETMRDDKASLDQKLVSLALLALTFR